MWMNIKVFKIDDEYEVDRGLEQSSPMSYKDPGVDREDRGCSSLVGSSCTDNFITDPASWEGSALCRLRGQRC